MRKTLLLKTDKFAQLFGRRILAFALVLTTLLSLCSFVQPVSAAESEDTLASAEPQTSAAADTALPEEPTAPTDGEAAPEEPSAPEIISSTDTSNLSMLIAPIPDTQIASGELTDTATWTLTTDSKGVCTLTVSGTGALPDYAKRAEHPWLPYGTPTRFIVEEGITSIGIRGFQSYSVHHLSLPTTLTQIKDYAFDGCSFYCTVVIPGNVKILSRQAFWSFLYEGIVLEEGVESLGQSALRFPAEYGHELTLPASLTTLGSQPFCNATAFHVAEGNPLFSASDGILFSKDGNKLIAYPGYKKGEEYTVPSHITEIGSYAFHEAAYLKKLTIPDRVGITTKLNQRFVSGGKLEQIYIGAGCTFPHTNYLVTNCANLHTLEYPDDLLTTARQYNLATACPKLRKDRVLPTTSQVLNFGAVPAGVEEFLYDAPAASFGSATNVGYTSGNGQQYHLIVGEHVNNLPARFTNFSKYAKSVEFAPNNQFTLVSGAFDDAVAPLCDLTGGTYWAGEAGELYRYDGTSKTATLVYCPANLTTLTVPTTITPEEGLTCSVTAVGENMLAQAKQLSSLSFTGAEAITSVATSTFINCATLTVFNSQTTVSQAIATLPNAELGSDPFYGTGLKESASGSDVFTQTGKQELLAGDDSASLYIKASKGMETGTWEGMEDAGYFKQMTGDPLFLNISIQSTTADQQKAFRIYFQRTHESLEFFEGFQPGATINVEGQAITCHATIDPDIFYLQILPNPGDTTNFTLTFSYPSPTSPGGWLHLWVTQQTVQEADATPAQIIAPTAGSVCANWYATRQVPEHVLNYRHATYYVFDIVEGSDGLLHPKCENNNLSFIGWTQNFIDSESPHPAYGQNPITSVDCEYILEFPKGIQWNDTVLKAMADKKITATSTIYAGETAIGTFAAHAGTTMKDFSMTQDDQGRTVIRWTLVNASPNKRLQNKSHMPVTLNPLFMVVDPTQADAQLSSHYTLTTNITYHYAHGQTETVTQDNGRPVIRPTDLYINLQTVNAAAYMGEDHTVRVYATNRGVLPYTAPEEGVYTLRAETNNKFHVKPENMVRMFEEDTIGGLTITVKNARLGPWSSADGIHGGTADLTPTNSDRPGATTGNTLVITHSDAGYAVAVTGGSTYIDESLPEALKKAGYGITTQTTYVFNWDLNKADTRLTVPAGGEIPFHIYATAKDVTQVLSEDERGSTSSVSQSLLSSLAQYSPANKQVGIRWLNNVGRVTLKPDAQLVKEVYHDGEPVRANFSFPEEAVLDYMVSFSHFGQGAYDDLPIVDDLYGDQYLLVRKDQNADHPQLQGLEVYRHKGVDYYILTEGTYDNVVVGLEDGKDWCVADSIVVHRNCGEPTNIFDANLLHKTYIDIHTRIKWYYPSLFHSDDYQINITYQALASIKRGEGLEYNIENTVWANDRQNSRLYNYIAFGYELLEHKKQVVVQRGDTPEQDKLLEDFSFTPLREGETVTYRLSLEGVKNGSNYTLKGNEIADVLPRVPQGFRWEKEDIRVDAYVNDAHGIIGDLTTDWELSDEFSYKTSEPNQQFILWDEDVSIPLIGNESNFYIYVTLTYPSGKEWDSFVAANGGSHLENEFMILSADASVFHGVVQTGDVLLQKGVFATQRSNYFYPANTTRSHFANASFGDTRFVTYYALIHNDGTKRLYLDEMYDLLPAGVTYHSMWKDASSRNVTQIVTPGGLSNLYVTGENADSFRSATVTALSENGKVTFTFSAGTGNHALRYDEHMEKYYLDKGEAIAFAYLCQITSKSAETGNTILNTLALPYYDYADVQPKVSDALFTANATTNFPVSDQNNGTCHVLTQEEATDRYGLPTAGNGSWLVSEVKQTRVTSSVGIDKLAQYYSTSGSALIPYEGFALPTATIYWKVTAFNESSSDLRDYTVEDMLPYPYAFQGDITYKVFYADGTQKTEGTLFKVGARQKNDTSFSLSGTTYTLGNTYSSSGNSFTLTRDGQNEHLTMRFKESSVIIPEKGWVEFLIPTVNVHEVLKSAVYTNRATITVPDSFDPDQVIHGSVVRDDAGKVTGVTDSASVITSNIAATTSLKKVTELAHPTNTASSSDSIILQDRDSAFRYTLDVTSKVARGDMDYLTVIDTLPQPGDHSLFDASVPRNSEFTVSLAEDSAFSVSLISPNGTETPLDTSQYTLSFHTSKTLFTDDDWRGKAGDWTADAGSARAIRIHIPDASFIPEKGTVRIAFNARIQGEAQLGSVAWNGFGYRYGLRQSLGSVLDLEAMPPDVGVRIPTLPRLQKQLLDMNGDPLRAQEDITFRFLVYEGEEISGNWNTESELTSLLSSSGRRYQVFSVTVPENASESAFENLTEDAWQWENSKSYTVLELPGNGDFRFTSFGNSRRNSFSFTYYADRNFSIQCKNTKPNWDLKVLKVDSENNALLLKNALFALYCAEESQQMSDERYEALAVKPPRTVTAEDATWYLYSIAVTDADGRILWKNLQSERYYLLEVIPPAGYLLSSAPGQTVDRSRVSDGILTVTVQNTAGYELPNTGSVGTHLFTAAGLVLMLPCLLLLLKKRRKT